jgi:acetyl esterase
MTALTARFPALDRDIATLLEDARAAGLPPLTELDPATLRERVRAGNQLCADGPEVASIVETAPVDGVVVRRYEPREVLTDVPLVWFHGGGWTTGDLDYSDGFCRRLADGVGCVVDSVGYRLAPEHPFPAAVDDAVAAVRAVAGTGRVLVGGDSAGGNLAAVCAQELPDAVRGQLLVYPVLDTDVTRESYRRNDGLVLGPREMSWFFDRYLPSALDRTSPRAAPLRAVSLTRLAPAVLVVAGHDPLFDEGVAYAEALHAAGVGVTLLDFGPLVHGFLRYTGQVPAAVDAAELIVAATANLLR